VTAHLLTISYPLPASVQPHLQPIGIEPHVGVEQFVPPGEGTGVAVLIEPGAEEAEHVLANALRAVGCLGMAAGDPHQFHDGRMQVARQALEIAASIDIYTNDHITIEEL